jgi:hypothetical protein
MIFNISIFSAATHQVSFSIPKHLRFYWTCTDTGLMANKTFRLVHILIYQWCRWWYGKFPMPMIWVEDLFSRIYDQKKLISYFSWESTRKYVRPLSAKRKRFSSCLPKRNRWFSVLPHVHIRQHHIYINFTCEQL